MVVCVLIGGPFSGKREVLEILCASGFRLIKIGDENTDHIVPFKSFVNMKEASFFLITNWKEKYVCYGIKTKKDFFEINQRPFSISIFIENPKTPNTEEYIGLIRRELCDITIINNSNYQALQKTVNYLELANVNLNKMWKIEDENRIYMEMAFSAAKFATCMKRQVGSVLVDKNKKFFIGYNGTAEGQNKCIDGGCIRCNNGTKNGIGFDYCMCIHAESLVIMRAGLENSAGSRIYVTLKPCLQCASLIIQARIKEVYYFFEYYENREVSEKINKKFQNQNIKIEKIKPKQAFFETKNHFL